MKLRASGESLFKGSQVSRQPNGRLSGAVLHPHRPSGLVLSSGWWPLAFLVRSEPGGDQRGTAAGGV